jgi:hypothetical protein
MDETAVVPWRQITGQRVICIEARKVPVARKGFAAINFWYRNRFEGVVFEKGIYEWV